MKKTYNYGENIDLTNATITITMLTENSSTRAITLNMISGYNSTNAGVQTITVSYLDKTKTFEVTVLPKEEKAPIITLDENNIYEIEIGENIPQFAATAVSGEDLETSINVDITNNIVNTELGTYIVTFKAQDPVNNKITVITKQFKVVDTIIPEITFEDSESIWYIEVNSQNYSIPQANATDNSGETITVKANINNLDITKLGTYTIIYTATDSSNNTKTSERTVVVRDTIKPEFVKFVDGTSSLLTISRGTEFVDNGAIFRDNYNGEMIVFGEGTVNYNKVGVYTITYQVNDSSGNTSEEIIRTVSVTEYPPVISYYDEDGAKAILTDDKIFRYRPIIIFNRGQVSSFKKDGQTAVFVENEKLTDGEYEITVDGGDGTSTTRTFIVDTTAPVITGISTGRYQAPVTITFEDVSDVYRACIINEDTQEQIVLIENGTWVVTEHQESAYIVATPGLYTITAQDKYGNAIIPITILVQLP